MEALCTFYLALTTNTSSLSVLASAELRTALFCDLSNWAHRYRSRRLMVLGRHDWETMILVLVEWRRGIEGAPDRIDIMLLRRKPTNEYSNSNMTSTCTSVRYFYVSNVLNIRIATCRSLQRMQETDRSKNFWFVPKSSDCSCNPAALCAARLRILQTLFDAPNLKFCLYDHCRTTWFDMEEIVRL